MSTVNDTFKNKLNVSDDMEFDPEAENQIDWGYLEAVEEPNASDVEKDTYVSQHNGSDISLCSQNELIYNLDQAYKLKQATLVYGDPGIGKSAIVLEFAMQKAKELGKKFFNWHDNKTVADSETLANVMEFPEKYFVFIDIRAAQLNPEDLVGIPDIGDSRPYLSMKQPKWVWFLSQPAADGVLFLDELNQGTEHVLKAMFQLVLDRQVAGTRLSNHFSLVGAGNLGGQYNQPIPIALTNRFRVLVMKADPQEWLNWALTRDENGNKRADESIINFVKSDPGNNFYVKPDKDPNNPFATPRSLVSLSKAIALIKGEYFEAKKAGLRMPLSIYKVIGNTAAQMCGVVWARKFIIYLQHVAAFKWDGIINSPKEFNDVWDSSKKWAATEFLVRKLVWAAGPKTAETPKAQKLFTDVITFLTQINVENATWFLKYLRAEDDSRFLVWYKFAHNGKYDDDVKKKFAKRFKEVGEIVQVK